MSAKSVVLRHASTAVATVAFLTPLLRRAWSREPWWIVAAFPCASIVLAVVGVRLLQDGAEHSRRRRLAGWSLLVAAALALVAPVLIGLTFWAAAGGGTIGAHA